MDDFKKYEDYYTVKLEGAKQFGIIKESPE